MAGDHFVIADYVVLTCVLSVSIFTGVIIGWKSRHKASSTRFFLLADRKMHVLPVSCSLFVSWMSCITFLGGPPEVYSYGFIYVMMIAGYLLSLPVIAHFFAPYYNSLNIVSIFQFLETKYSRGFRLTTSICMIFMTILWQGTATYAPGLALAQATAVPAWACIVLIGAVTTFYTALGGMKAVLWADTLQFMVMLAGQLAIVIEGCRRLGGVQEVWKIAEEGGRINFESSISTFNPLSRAAMWTYFIGGFFRLFNPYISSQMLVQRYSTVSTPKEATIVTYLNMPMYAVVSSLIAMDGLILYGMYKDCDPVLSGRIARRDQLMPLLFIDLLGFLPGLPGLFMSTLLAASMSSMSSAMNSLAANLLEDIVSPVYTHIKGTQLQEATATAMTRAFAALFGVVITLTAFLPLGLPGATIFSFTQVVMGALTGPTAGVFFIAVIFPKIPTVPVAVGFLVSIVFQLWLGIGRYFSPSRPGWELLPVSTQGCPANTTVQELILPEGEPPPFAMSDIYQWNPILYYVSGFFITLITAATIALVTVVVQAVMRRYKPERDVYQISNDDGEPMTVLLKDGNQNFKAL